MQDDLQGGRGGCTGVGCTAVPGEAAASSHTSTIGPWEAGGHRPPGLPWELWLTRQCQGSRPFSGETPQMELTTAPCVPSEGSASPRFELRAWVDAPARIDEFLEAGDWLLTLWCPSLRHKAWYRVGAEQMFVE